ncbi:TetR/AcrR family transcriptional regulator [Celeribacter halophilus]|uniref:TetR/AcrR family transcriptional regulator n=1 Tax=Celeribacter halophilus TaxID=576117 RepID=UPI003A8E5C5E
MSDECSESPASPAQQGVPPTQKCRHPAGKDPEKRRQILSGAWQVFVDQGFDAATMNGICKAAGVSKGTLYVYFKNKEDLFVALVEDRREAFFAGIVERLEDAGTIEDHLLAYASGLSMQVNSENVIRAQRIVISVVERMPDLGARFYDAGARYFLGHLAEFLRTETEAGHLAVPDPEFAAAQFIELATAGTWRARIFGRRRTEPSAEEITRTAREAVRMFMATYGV